MAANTCGHQFCNYCWQYYLTNKIMEEGECDTITCAAHNCDILVDDETVLQHVTDVTTRRRYQQLITNKFVEVRERGTKKIMKFQ